MIRKEYDGREFTLEKLQQDALVISGDRVEEVHRLARVYRTALDKS